VSNCATEEPKPSPYLNELVEEIADFARLVRLTRMWEIGWVAENGDGEGDPTVFDRLRVRLRRMLPTEYELNDDEDSPPVYEEALDAAYRSSGCIDGGLVRLVVTEPTLFGESGLECEFENVGGSVSVVVHAPDGTMVEKAVIRPEHVHYADLVALLEDVADLLSENNDLGASDAV
jgi:hypothetical protein